MQKSQIPHALPQNDDILSSNVPYATPAVYQTAQNLILVYENHQTQQADNNPLVVLPPFDTSCLQPPPAAAPAYSTFKSDDQEKQK